MKLSIETDRRLNRLIPKLLKENKSISKEIKTRIKISSIFNEFEKKAKNDFNFYIKDSNKRYTQAKNGLNIEHYIDESQPKYENKLSKIMNDKFYTDLNLKPEKEKMKHKTTKKIYMNIKDLMTNIKTSLDSSKSRKKLNFNSLYNNHVGKKLKRIRKYNKCNTENELSLKKKNIDEKMALMNKNENDIKNVFNLENLNINNSIEKYKNSLSTIKIPFIKDKNYENEENKKLNLNLPIIKMIIYHKSNTRKKFKDSNIEKFDISKLLPFSKYGRHLQKQQSENKIIKSEDNRSFLTETINKKYNYESTNDMAVSSAKKNVRLKNDYSSKRRKIKELLENNIPSIEDYENIIKDRIQRIKNRRNNINKVINRNQRFHFLSRKQLFNLKIDKNIELLKEKEREYNK